MAISIVTQPKDIDFVGNALPFKVKSNNSSVTEFYVTFYVETYHGSGAYVTGEELQYNAVTEGSDKVATLYDVEKYLASFFPGNELDLPAYNETGANLIAWQKFAKKWYVSLSNDESESLSTIGSEKTLLNGRALHIDYPSENIPAVLAAGNRLLSYEGDSIKVWSNSQYYLTFANNLSGYPNYKVKLVQYLKSGTTDTSYPNVSLSTTNGDYSGFGCGPANLSLNVDCYKYTVTVVSNYEGETVLSQTITFVLKKRPEYGRQFILKNKYGLPQVVLSNGVAKSKVKFKAHEQALTVNSGYAVTDPKYYNTGFETREHVTVNIGYRTEPEARLLAIMLASTPLAYIADEENSRFLPITIDPKSIDLLDEGKDLLSVEFQYKPAYDF